MREIIGAEKTLIARLTSQGHAVLANLQHMTLRQKLFLAGPAVILALVLLALLLTGRYVTTDNAYVKASTVSISAEVSGPVVAIDVRENQRVTKGQILFRIDDRPYRVALARAEAALDVVRTEIEALKASYREKSGQIAKSESDLAFAQQEFDRQAKLAAQKVVSKSALDEVRHALDVARNEIAIATEQRAQILSALGGDPDAPVTVHPRYRAAQAERDAALLDVERTVVQAPFDGAVSQTPKPGAHVTAGMPVLRLVATTGAWVEANFKETELTRVMPGLAVRIRVDTYPGHTWRGRVESIGQATGAEYAILPPENATGNWVKVVQRIPVRIALDPAPQAPLLRAGMSVTVRVDTRSNPARSAP